MKEDFVIDLNELEYDGTIVCPYCNKGKQYLYGDFGKTSQNCDRCHRMVLWDFDTKKAYRARVRKYVS